MNTRGRVSAAVIGAGLMGRWHARAIENARGTVTAVVDADLDRAARLARRHGARAFGTLIEAAAGSTIDVAHICTPLPTHLPLTRDAIALNWHVLVEKPLSATAAETETLLLHARQHGRLLCPVHQFVHQRGIEQIRRALPRMGPVRHLLAIVCSAGADAVDDDGRAQVAMDILPHPLSLFGAILDAPIADVSWQVCRSAAGEISAIGLSGSTTLALVISMSGRPTTNLLRVTAARGTAHADLFHGFAVIEPGGVSRARKILHPFRLASATLAGASANLVRRAVQGERAYPGLRSLVSAFYDAVRVGGAAPISAERILDVARARDLLSAASLE